MPRLRRLLKTQVLYQGIALATPDSYQGIALQLAEKFGFRIRASLYSSRKNSGFVSGHRFSDASKSFEIRRPFRGWAAISDAFLPPLREPPANFVYRNFVLQSGLAHPSN